MDAKIEVAVSLIINHLVVEDRDGFIENTDIIKIAHKTTSRLIT